MNNQPYNPNGPSYNPQTGQPYNPNNQAYNPQYAQPNNQQYTPQYNQQQYAQPVNKSNEVMSVGSYIGMFILSSIPIVNIICWIIWLVSPNTNKNKKNYIIANIVLVVIAFLILAILVGICVAIGVSLPNDFDMFY